LHVLIYCCVAIPDRIRDITLRIIIITSVIISLISHFANKKALAKFDMYPLYWTTSKGGILMRYSYEFNRIAIELFYLNTKLWDTMVLSINLKGNHY